VAGEDEGDAPAAVESVEEEWLPDRERSEQALHLEGAKVAEVLVSAASGDTVEMLAVTSLEARDRVLTLEDGRSATPLNMAYKVP